MQPVIILTAHATNEKHQELVSAGTVDFLAKPYEVEQLRQTCESVLRYSELMETCTEFRETAGAMREITNRVYAADRFLSMGKVWVAVNRLKEALRDQHQMPPTEHEWENSHEKVDAPL